MEKTVIALGFFDGVHRGHGALLRKTAERARELGAVPAAFTFDRPPKEVVTGQPVYLINSNRDRQGLMERLYGIERVIFAPFDREMMTMPWEAYLEMLIGTYGAVHFVAGHDHRFGHKNAGNVQSLRKPSFSSRRYSGRASRSAPRTSGRWWRRATWSARRTFWATGTA